jgi:inorganic pyrophosphatase
MLLAWALLACLGNVVSEKKKGISLKNSSGRVFDQLTAFIEEPSKINVVIETPQGSRNKYKYDEQYGLFMLSGVLPAGAVFPFDFGYVPSTIGEDGDPLDVLLLLDQPVFVGCLVPSRLIGVIEADQTETDGETVKNDRLIGIALDSHNHRHIEMLDQLNQNLVAEIEHFFISYNDMRGRKFKLRGRSGVDRATQLLEEGVKRFQKGK